jgi:hypothetical protein
MSNTLIQEISQNQADLIKSFAIFYLLLVGNYVGFSIFTCSQINYIHQNKWLQLFISFLLFFFLVTLLSNTGKLEFTPPIEKLFYSVFYFMGFLIVMRLDMRISALVLLLIFLLYFLELNKDFYLESGKEITDPLDQDIYNSNKFWITLDWPFKLRLFPVNDTDFIIINQIETIIYYFIIFLLVIGFISYGGEMHDTLRKTKNLTWIDIITDTDICILKDRKSFLHYLKVGLGLKL